MASHLRIRAVTRERNPYGERKSVAGPHSRCTVGCYLSVPTQESGNMRLQWILDGRINTTSGRVVVVSLSSAE